MTCWSDDKEPLWDDLQGREIPGREMTTCKNPKDRVSLVDLESRNLRPECPNHGEPGKERDV